VVQLDAWNWEDAAYKMDNAIHLTLPTLFPSPAFWRWWWWPFWRCASNRSKKSLDKIEEIKTFFREAKAWLAESSHKENNLKFEAVKGYSANSKSSSYMATR